MSTERSTGMDVRELRELGLPEEAIEAWVARGISGLTQVQATVFRSEAFRRGRNLLVVAPTSSGKTFIAEVCLVQAAVSLGRSIYLAPFKAMANEKYEEFHRTYTPLGTKVVISTGDHAEHDAQIASGDYHIALVTPEKLTRLIVSNPGVLGTCTLLVADEVQLIGDETRGPELEMLVTKALMQSGTRVIGLSATLSDLNGLDRWLRAEAIIDNLRPVPLVQAVFRPDGTVAHLAAPPGIAAGKCGVADVTADGDTGEVACTLALEHAKRGEQVLVFCSTQRACEETAARIAALMESSRPSRATLAQLSLFEETGARAFLEDNLGRGVAYHHAGLSVSERLLVMRLFREGQLKVVVATTTLAMGVNLPADTVIMADLKRYSYERRGDVPIEVGEYLNCAGRAGRYGLRDLGRCLLVADSAFVATGVRDRYVNARPSAIESALPKAGGVAPHALRVIAAGLAATGPELVRLFEGSFANQGVYGQYEAMPEAVSSAVKECLSLGLMKRSGEALTCTEMGRVCAGSGVRLESFATIIELVGVVLHKGSVDPLELGFELCCLAEAQSQPPYLSNDEWRADSPRQALTREPEELRKGSRIRAVAEAQSLPSRDDAAALKKALLMESWRSGAPARQLERDFRTNLGRIMNLAETLSWLIETTAAAAHVAGCGPAVLAELEALAEEAMYGVPRSACRIAALRVPGLTRANLLRLVSNERGVTFTSPDQLLDTDDEDFAGIISPELANRVKTFILERQEETQLRLDREHSTRAERLGRDPRLVRRVYESEGEELERALGDLLVSVGVECRRVSRQAGPVDLAVHSPDGPVAVQVTRSQTPGKPIPQAKAFEVMSCVLPEGEPVNCITIGYPDFHENAIRAAERIAAERARPVLLVPLAALVEACIRVMEGRLSVLRLSEMLARSRGYLSTTAMRRLRDESETKGAGS